MEAVVLHAISDAKHCVRNELYRDRVLLSTNPGVDTYLKERHGICCRTLSAFLSVKDTLGHKKACSDMVDDMLKKLDHKISPILNDKFGLKLNYFNALYSYMGKLQCLGYSCFADSVKMASEELGIDKIYLYDYRFNTLMDTHTNMGDVASFFFSDLEFEVIGVSGKGADLEELWANACARLKRACLVGFKSLTARIGALRQVWNSNSDNFSHKKKTILCTTPLHELDFLKEQLKEYNVFDPLGRRGRMVTKLSMDPAAGISFTESADSPLAKLFLKDISHDFLDNLKSYLGIVCSIKKVNEKYGISMGLWGASPNRKGSTLVYEYLKSEGIKVLGAQHGAVYGDSFQPWHFDSDFERCDYFMSYGFTDGDLKALYADKNIGCKILPLGKVKYAKPHNSAKKIDVLFPITNSISMLEDGMMRLSPHELARRQLALLEYLNSLRGLAIYVKPIPCSNGNNCSAFHVFKRLKNLRLVNHMSLQEFLGAYSPRAVLVEYPSTPLTEVLHLDAEVFLMGDEVIPYGKMAFEELSRRVHYSEDVVEMISKIGLFLDGKLSQKRDDAFYKHYIFKKDPEKEILKIIGDLA